ncbi:hypothetical protein NC651_011197 [Populus alba x Populus x berolinensis]|nr:hypothetical protein NC651_011197 [Populus alba x Populus x berolinensis]
MKLWLGCLYSHSKHFDNTSSEAPLFLTSTIIGPMQYKGGDGRDQVGVRASERSLLGGSPGKCKRESVGRSWKVLEALGSLVMDDGQVEMLAKPEAPAVKYKAGYSQCSFTQGGCRRCSGGASLGGGRERNEIRRLVWELELIYEEVSKGMIATKIVMEMLGASGWLQDSSLFSPHRSDELLKI